MKLLVLTILLSLFVSSVSEANRGRNFPPEQSYQFRQQCLNAGNSTAMCQCALHAFRSLIDPRDVEIRHHGAVNIEVLRIRDVFGEHLLAHEVERCERQHAPKSRG